MRKLIDPNETYIVREIFCCGEGHCPGIRFTHWEEGEACIYIHDEATSNYDCHYYWRLALIPLYKGNPDKGKDQYSSENGDFWEFANLPENENRWVQFPLAPKELKEGDRVEPATA